jgi:hypothetical protein
MLHPPLSGSVFFILSILFILSKFLAKMSDFGGLHCRGNRSPRVRSVIPMDRRRVSSMMETQAMTVFGNFRTPARGAKRP